MPPNLTVADVLAAQRAQSPEALDKKAQEEKFAQLTEQLNSIEKSIYQAFSGLIQYMDGKVTKTEVVNQLASIGTPDVLKLLPTLESVHETLKTHENVDLSEVTSVIRELLTEAKKIPKELPTIPEAKLIDYTAKFKNLEVLLRGVEGAIKGQKLVAEAPIVHVPEAKVDVQAPDLSGIEQGQKEIVAAVKKIVIPEYKQDNASLEKLLKQLDKSVQELPNQMPRSSGGSVGRASPYEDSNGGMVFVRTNKDGSLPTGEIPHKKIIDETTTPSVTAAGGTQAIATVNNVSVTQSAGSVVASGGTQSVTGSGVISASITQVAGTITASGGTQSISAAISASIAQSAATITASGGTQLIATQVSTNVGQSAANVTASGRTQVVTTINNVSISQVAGNVTVTGGTQVVTSSQLASVTQLAATVTATGGTATVSTNASIAQTAASVIAAGGTQDIYSDTGAISVSVTQVAANVTARGGTQIISTATGALSIYPVTIYDIDGNRYKRVTATKYMRL